jgi:hypothetical protein
MLISGIVLLHDNARPDTAAGPRALKLHGLSPHANYTDRLSDRRLSAKLVPTLADSGCRVVSATIPPQSLIFGFLDRSRYLREKATQI